VGYVVTDLDGVVREANMAASDLLARDEHLLIGRPLVDLVVPGRRPEFRTLVREAGAGGRWQDEVPFLQPDGESVLLLAYAAGPSEGQPTIRWALAEAATAENPGRRELVASYRLQRSRLSALLDRLEHAVLTVDRGLRVSYANAAAERLWPRSPPVVGHELSDPWREPSLRALVATVFPPRAEPADARITVDAERAVYDVVVLPPDPSGEALIVIADVSASERRGRAQREFVANAAHQLRTPVAAIASAIEVLQGGAKEVPEARDRFLDHLDKQCSRLVRLTRALLQLARAQALSEAPEVELVPLRPLLESLARALHPGAGVEVRVECPFDLAALTNADLLEQAIGNLGENAAKVTTAGEIVLCAEPLTDGSVHIVVSDTGSGGEFPVDGQFERFYRDPASQGEGFGLGLAIAAEALRVLGGELRLETSEAGTRAVADLPAARLQER
jgi:two-component system phosphate regulon sensor histidine kinase PhoR